MVCMDVACTFYSLSFIRIHKHVRETGRHTLKKLYIHLNSFNEYFGMTSNLLFIINFPEFKYLKGNTRIVWRKRKNKVKENC